MLAEQDEQFEPVDVKVGEVGRVGFVEVVVAFEEAGAGGGDEGLEEGGWAWVGGEAEAGGREVGEEAFDEADVPDERQTFKIQKGEYKSEKFPDANLAFEAQGAAQS